MLHLNNEVQFLSNRSYETVWFPPLLTNCFPERYTNLVKSAQLSELVSPIQFPLVLQSEKLLMLKSYHDKSIEVEYI